MPDSRFDRLESKVDVIIEKVSAVQSDIAVNKVEERTNASHISDIQVDLAPIKRHVNRVEGAAKLLALMASLGLINWLIHAFKS